MLFNYHYVSHSIEKFQEYLDHLLKEVWCKPTGDFSIELLHPELKAIVEDISNDNKVQKDHLFGPIQRIYNLFKTQLNAAQRLQVAIWYDNNNDIEALCANDPLKATWNVRSDQGDQCGPRGGVKEFLPKSIPGRYRPHGGASTDR